MGQVLAACAANNLLRKISLLVALNQHCKCVGDLGGPLRDSHSQLGATANKLLAASVPEDLKLIKRVPSGVLLG